MKNIGIKDLHRLNIICHQPPMAQGVFWELFNMSTVIDIKNYHYKEKPLPES